VAHLYGIGTPICHRVNHIIIQEKNMKKLALVMLVITGLLSGCVAYDTNDGRHDGAHRDRDRDGVPNRMDRDRDGDGVPNRNDSSPNNPNRY
jgi:hypothetical protein